MSTFQLFKINTFQLILFTLTWIDGILYSFTDDVFTKDISDVMQIGLSDKGYKSVQLKCGSGSMIVNLETQNDFLGVIYTRGSFYDKESPCFYDTGNRRGQRSFKLKFPLDKCKTKQDGDIYSNVLVLQHDKELIMPGDAAFNLECGFNQPKDITVEAKLNIEQPVASRITLMDADPSQKPDSLGKKSMVESYTNSVIITPNIMWQHKEEL